MSNAKKATFLVATVWKNSLQYGPQAGQPYWTFVMKDNSRVACYDRNAITDLGFDPDEQRTEVKKKLVLFFEIRKNKSVIIRDPSRTSEPEPQADAQGYEAEDEAGGEYDEEPAQEEEEVPEFPSNPAPAKKKFYGKTGAWNRNTDREYNEVKDAEIGRMSALKTAVEYTGHHQIKGLEALENITTLFQNFVVNSRWGLGIPAPAPVPAKPKKQAVPKAAKPVVKKTTKKGN